MTADGTLDAMTATECPCGSGAAEATCCGPIVDGSAPAPTALALMRSRYTAYVRGAIDYVMASHDASTRARMDRAAAAKWSRDTAWAGLDIVAVERGGDGDDDGVVEFVARGATLGKPFALHERSRFRRVDGRWFYLDGATIAPPAARAAPAPGRNEPCPCGSGLKYKRCHGR
nr:YchJ family protein [Kofleriaceae bacterium]